MLAFGDRLKTHAGAALDETGRDYLTRMQKATARMQHLIDGLLQYSRVGTKGHPFEPVPLDEVVADVVSDLETRIEQSGGRVEVGPLPVIEADKLQMRQLFQNLIGNALKFRKPDQPPVVRVVCRPGTNGCAEITVADNGIGFEEQYRERIFQLFQRLHGRDEYEGTGIGLSVCQKIAERHGGQLTAQSVPGEGSAFIVTLPVHHEEGGSP